MRRRHAARPQLPQPVGQRRGRAGVAVHDESLPQAPDDGLRPVQQAVSVGVGAVAVDRLDPRPQPVLLTEDLHPLLSLDQPSAQCVRGLPTDDQHRVARVAGGAVSAPLRTSPMR